MTTTSVRVSDSVNGLFIVAFNDGSDDLEPFPMNRAGIITLRDQLDEALIASAPDYDGQQTYRVEIPVLATDPHAAAWMVEDHFSGSSDILPCVTVYGPDGVKTDIDMATECPRE